jgi:nucleoside-diphosphate-sugar epimerase
MDIRYIALEEVLDLRADQRTRYQMFVGDIRTRIDIERAVRDIDAVVNLAAVVGSPACDARPDDARSINVDGTRLLTRLVPLETPVIHMSTCSVYGRVKEHICSETALPSPITLYGETKLHSETAVVDRGGVVLRAVTAYGPSLHPRLDLLVHTLIRFGLAKQRLKLFEPHAVRPVIHVEDISRGLLFSIENFDVMTGRIFNLASEDTSVTKMALATRVHELTGLEVDVDTTEADPDARDYAVDCCRIKKLGFAATRMLDAGLRETTDWLRQIV